ncbi:MFS transporter [Enterobacter hormaechei]|uniref:MFS transporter n=1 Tax=Enterobacter hormaechei TaxID=158836 RepID=A0AAX3Z077_9ENTR|nr:MULTISPECIES: MFS transporter [Enterobacter cloacae complex]UAS93631.1 MFS transporter [Enterobacter cloacae complex sp.]AJB72089.1 membrane protein [Enterobacter hormaechei subsp. hormaechei]EGK58038.1 major facilitator family transporter [Enterobacter hormaechei ATCC 49162]EGQ5308593.1 MFS transporter [Enterobacter hormaechei]EGQ5313651.1 MFS transporter [Enterobacter hormaechei]
MTYRSKIAVVFLLGFFLDLINMFIASVAFPAMARAFNTTPSALAWVSNGYIAGLTLVIPFSSILTRRIGPKRVILLSLLLFSAASVAAGLSSSLESLIAWRVVQGAGGGLLIPVGQALTWQQFKPHERARLSSAVMLVALLAPACSPAVGGMLVQAFSWRWIFFATLPVAIVTFALACAWLKTEPSPINTTRTVNLSLLTDPLLRLSMLIYVCVPGIFIGVNVTGMYYLQSEANMTPAATGMLMLPWSVASFLAITATGRYFNRIGPRPLVVIGCLLQATGILLLINVGPAMLLPAVAFALMGAGGSLCSSTAQSSAFLTMRPEDMPDASALWNLNRQLSFFAGALLLAQALSFMQDYLAPLAAWHWMFVFAAVITLLPVLYVYRLNNTQLLAQLQQEQA